MEIKQFHHPHLGPTIYCSREVSCCWNLIIDCIMWSWRNNVIILILLVKATIRQNVNPRSSNFSCCCTSSPWGTGGTATRSATTSTPPSTKQGSSMNNVICIMQHIYFGPWYSLPSVKLGQKCNVWRYLWRSLQCTTRRTRRRAVPTTTRSAMWSTSTPTRPSTTPSATPATTQSAILTTPPRQGSLHYIQIWLELETKVHRKVRNHGEGLY